METNRALTPSEVAERLQVAKNTVYELIKRGELRGYRVGNQVRVDEADLDAFRRPGTVSGTSSPVSVVISGQDGILDWLARALELRSGGVPVLRSMAGSYAGLSGLYLGTIQAAAIHLWNASEDRYNADFVRALVPGTPTTTLHLATRQVGWYVPEGNPAGLTGWESLANPDRVFANRERGSGIRVLLDGRLGQGRWPRPRGYDREYPSHSAVASAVARGEADYGLGNQRTALAIQGIEFLPLQTESYDLVVRSADLSVPPLSHLIEILQSESFRNELAGQGGYGIDQAGAVVDQT